MYLIKHQNYRDIEIYIEGLAGYTSLLAKVTFKQNTC